MQGDFRRILSQADPSNGAAAIDAIEDGLSALTNSRPAVAAQHLATLAFRFMGENRLDLGKPWTQHFKAPLRTRLGDAGDDVRQVGPRLDDDTLASLNALAWLFSPQYDRY